MSTWLLQKSFATVQKVDAIRYREVWTIFSNFDK